ncbi:MAG TPA: helix-turn-helix domain-containing protein [Atopostipes sp.]|jgi:excisionase family DNA binding protein|nr:helix-turn-helix domain-containing protein [Atopostipes sp.]
MEDELFKIDEIADYFKVSERTVQNWQAEGMPFKKYGRIVRFDLKEVVEWLEAKEEK